MGEKWNRMSVKAPPVYHVRADTMDVETLIVMKTTMGELVDALCKQTVLESERVCLQRIVYKLSNQMRHQKHFTFFRLISKCLRCYVSLDVLALMKSLLNEFERLVDQYEEQQYVPSLQTLQYHMVKLQCAAGILAKMASYCIQAYFPVQQVMAIGHFLTKNIMFLAILGRLWALSKYLIFQITKGFNRLVPLLPLFPASLIPWLSGNEELPHDLSVWIKTNWPELDINFKFLTVDQVVKKKKTEKAESLSGHGSLLQPASFFGGDSDLGVPVSNDEEELEESTGPLSKLGVLSSVSNPLFAQHKDIGVPVLDSWKRMEVKGKKVSPEKATCKDSPSAIEEPMVFDGVAHHEMRNALTLDFNSALFLKTLGEAKSCEEFTAACAAIRHRQRLWKGDSIQLAEELKEIERTLGKLQRGRPKKKKMAQCRNRISQVLQALTGGFEKGNHKASPKLKLLLPMIQECISGLSSVKEVRLSLTKNQRIELGPFHTLHTPKAVAATILRTYKKMKKMPGSHACKPAEMFLAAVRAVLVKVYKKNATAVRGEMKTGKSDTGSQGKAGTGRKVKGNEKKSNPKKSNPKKSNPKKSNLKKSNAKKSNPKGWKKQKQTHCQKLAQ